MRQPEIQRVQNAVVDDVTKTAQGVENAGEGPPAIGRHEVADILQQKRRRAASVENADDLEKQASPVVAKPAATADDAERLAGKPCAKQVVIRNAGGENAGDVAMRVEAEIRGVDDAGSLVDLRGENALKAKPGGGDMKPANPGEQVNECR